MIYVTASAVTLGDFLDLLLFLQGVGGLEVALLNIDQLVSKDFGNGLLGPEGVLTDSLGDQVDSLVHSSQGRHVNSLLSHHTTSSDSGGVFSGASLDDGIDENLEGVSSGEEVDDFEGVPDDADGLDLLTSVSSVELEGADEPLDDGAECLSELFALVSSGSVGDEDLGLGGGGGDVVNEAGISDLLEGRVTLTSSYDHLEKSLGAFSNPILLLLSSSRVAFSCLAAGLDMW